MQRYTRHDRLENECCVLSVAITQDSVATANVWGALTTPFGAIPVTRSDSFSDSVWGFGDGAAARPTGQLSVSFFDAHLESFIVHPGGGDQPKSEDQPHAKPNLAVVSGFLQGLSLRAPMLKPLDAVRWPLPCSVHV